MKFDEVKANSEPRKDYPKVQLIGKLERVIKKGTTSKGSWIVLGFKDLKTSAIFFAEKKEDMDNKLDGIDVGSDVEIELSGSKRGNVLKNIQLSEGGEEGETPSSSRLNDEDLRAFMPDSVFINSFKCGSCGEQNGMFKQELRAYVKSTVNQFMRRYYGQEN